MRPFLTARSTFLTLFVVVIALGGCARPDFRLSPEHLADYQKEGLVPVIARFTTDLEGEIIGGGVRGEQGGWADPELVDFEGDGRIVKFAGQGAFIIRRHSLDSLGFRQHGDGGWLRILLRPGAYVIRLMPPISSPVQNQARERWKVLHLYKFTVPRDVETLYLGSFQARCRGRKDSFGTKDPKVCSDKLVISDERALAVRATLKSTAGTLTTVLARPFENATASSADAIRRNWPPRLEIKNVAKLVGPDWKLFHSAQREREEARRVNHKTVPTLLLKARWSPCVAQLDSALRSADLKGTFRGRFQSHARAAMPDDRNTESGGTPAGSKADDKIILEANIVRVMFRKCREAETYCVEVAVRMKLRTRVGNKILYDAIHVYSAGEGPVVQYRYPYAIHVYSTREGASINPDGYDPSRYYRMWRGHYFWERPLDRISPCRNIADYCGPDGHQLTLREVETALDAVAAKVVRELSGP